MMVRDYCASSLVGALEQCRVYGIEAQCSWDEAEVSLREALAQEEPVLGQDLVAS